MEVFDARGFQNTGAARAGREESHNPDPWAVGGFFLTDSEFLSHIYDRTCVIKAIVNHTAFCVNSVPFLFIFKEISDCKVLVFLTTFLLCPSLWAGLGGPLYGFFVRTKPVETGNTTGSAVITFLSVSCQLSQISSKKSLFL